MAAAGEGRGDGRKVIGLRADMDALPITEANDLPYKSTVPGKMHACGHDGHTATLLAAAVCVKFIWQPAEEAGGGAGRLVRAGVLDGRIGPKASRTPARTRD